MGRPSCIRERVPTCSSGSPGGPRLPLLPWIPRLSMYESGPWVDSVEGLGTTEQTAVKPLQLLRLWHLPLRWFWVHTWVPGAEPGTGLPALQEVGLWGPWNNHWNCSLCWGECVTFGEE